MKSFPHTTKCPRSGALSVDPSNARMDLDPHDPHKQPARGDERTEVTSSDNDRLVQTAPNSDIRDAAATSMNTSNGTLPKPIRKVTPGVVFVGGGRGAEEDIAVEVNDDMSDDPIVAQLAPDEADLEAMLTEKLSPKITQEVEQRLVKTITQEVEDRARQRDDSIVVVAEAKVIPPYHALTARIKWIVAGLLLFVVGGVGFWIVRGNKDKYGTRVEEITEELPTRDPLAVPTTSQSEPPTLFTSLRLDPLVEELQSWIAPTKEDLLTFLDPTSPQSQALAWLQDDPITLTPGRSTQTVLERYVVAVLYYSTSGPSWTYYQLNPADVCTWNHGLPFVNGTGSESWYGIFCTDDGGSIERIDFN